MQKLLIIGFSNYDLARYRRDGTFIDLTPYMTAEIMPNLTRILAENPDIHAAITMNDGNIYGLPSAERMGTKGIGKDENYNIFTIRLSTQVLHPHVRHGHAVPGPSLSAQKEGIEANASQKLVRGAGPQDCDPILQEQNKFSHWANFAND